MPSPATTAIRATVRCLRPIQPPSLRPFPSGDMPLPATGMVCRAPWPGTICHMATITADDIRVLAQSTDPDAVLALVGDEVRVVPGFNVMGGQVVLTKVQLVEEVGEDVT